MAQTHLAQTNGSNLAQNALKSGAKLAQARPMFSRETWRICAVWRGLGGGRETGFGTSFAGGRIRRGRSNLLSLFFEENL